MNVQNRSKKFSLQAGQEDIKLLAVLRFDWRASIYGMTVNKTNFLIQLPDLTHLFTRATHWALCPFRSAEVNQLLPDVI